YARIRNLESTDGKVVKVAGPSTPVIMTGFKSLPEFGDEFVVVDSEKSARSLAEQQHMNRQNDAGKLNINSNEPMRMINRTNKLTELNIISKADVQGSLTSVIDSL